MGLGLGAAFLAFGMAHHAREHAYAQRLTAAATAGHASTYLEAEGRGLRLGLERYAFRGGLDAVALPSGAERLKTLRAQRRADLECLTTAVYYEARGESLRGQAAVAQVVMNRVKHPAFPKTVCGVVFQGAGNRGCQFSFACDGSMRGRREAVAWDRARDVAARALAGAIRVEVGAATHFHTTAVSPIWAPHMSRVASVGAHVFYKFAPYRLRRTPVGEGVIEQAVLTRGPSHAAAEMHVTPAVEKAIEASLLPAAATTPEVKAKAAPPVPPPVVAEEARLAPAETPAAAS